MSLKLREFIKKIRACKTLEEERCLINKESAEIRNLNKVIYIFINLFLSFRINQRNMPFVLLQNALQLLC